MLNALDHRTIDYLAVRLGPHAEACDLPTDPLDLWLWIASAYAAAHQLADAPSIRSRRVGAP